MLSYFKLQFQFSLYFSSKILNPTAMENNTIAPEATSAAPVKTPWRVWQKLTFRFFLLFFGITSILCWAFNIYQDLLGISFTGIDTLYNPFAGLI